MDFDIKDFSKFGGGIAENIEDLHESGKEDDELEEEKYDIMMTINQVIKKNLAEKDIFSPTSAVLNAQTRVKIKNK